MKTLIIIALPIFFAGWMKAAAQDNLGFESGLAGWIRLGKAKNTVIMHSNMYKGKSCVRIGPGYGGVMKRVEVDPLSIVQFNAYIRSAATGGKGYSFLRFYNDANTLLLEYRSQAITSTSYQSAGNYTETPPDTKYMTIGIDREDRKSTR